jgi:hypothetical protein
MRRIAIFATIVVAALTAVVAAQAGVSDGLGPWADYVVAHNQGCAYIPPDMTTCQPVRAERSDPQAAVGPAESPAGPDNNPIPVGSFYSLGFTSAQKGEAFITLGFDNPVCNQPGLDLGIQLYEITKEPYPPETVHVYASYDNVNYFFAGDVTKDGSVSLPAQVPVAHFVRLVDASNPALFTNVTPDADGYDLDGVRSLNTTTCNEPTGCRASRSSSR